MPVEVELVAAVSSELRSMEDEDVVELEESSEFTEETELIGQDLRMGQQRA